MPGLSTALLHETLRRLGGGECAGVGVAPGSLSMLCSPPWRPILAVMHGTCADCSTQRTAPCPPRDADVGDVNGFNGELDIALVLVCRHFDGLQAVVVKSTCFRRTARNLLPADASHS